MSRAKKVGVRPSDCVSDFNLLNALMDIGTLYDADGKSRWLSIMKFPGFVKTSLRRVLARSVGKKKPEMTAAMCACLSYGVRQFYTHADISGFLAAREKLLRAEHVSASEMDELAMWFGSCPLSIPDFEDSGLRRQNL